MQNLRNRFSRWNSGFICGDKVTWFRICCSKTKACFNRTRIFLTEQKISFDQSLNLKIPKPSIRSSKVSTQFCETRRKRKKISSKKQYKPRKWAELCPLIVSDDWRLNLEFMFSNYGPNYNPNCWETNEEVFPVVFTIFRDCLQICKIQTAFVNIENNHTIDILAWSSNPNWNINDLLSPNFSP